MRTAFFEIQDWEEKYLRNKLKGHKLHFSKVPLNARNVNKVKDAEILISFIYSELNSQNLSKLPKLKLIATMSTGFDHIDLEFCRNKGIKVCNVPFYGENTVAEHAFALILALSRNLYNSIEKARKEDFSLKGLKGFDLKGKTLGVIGVGHIGEHVIKIAKGFEMKAIGYSRHKDKKLSKKLGFKWASSLENLLKNSDIITIHVPLNKGTEHLINMGNVKKIKKGAYLINTARGEIVDTDALKYALDNNILAGAGLDVLEGEEDIKEERELLSNRIDKCDWETFLQNHLLLKNKNVIITPHCAFYTQEALERILDTTIGNIKGFLKGRIRNRVA